MPEMTYPEAMADVRARVKKAKTSFAAGMGSLPVPRREAMYALYAFCREVDDIADDSPTPALRDEGLKLWRDRIANLFQNDKAEDSICVALRPAIDRFQLVEKDFQDIIDGMEMDAAETIVAPSRTKLDDYCDRVASAVGRASVRIFGDPSPNGSEVAYHLGRALQLTNILRDLGEDAARGRLYLPEELLATNGITTRDVAAILSHPKLPDVCRALGIDAESHFAKADAAMKKSPSFAMRPARIMRAYYGAIYQKLKAKDWKNPAKRVSLSFFEKLWLALRTLFL